jgi:hypothetical protein
MASSNFSECTALPELKGNIPDKRNISGDAFGSDKSST